MGPVRLRLPGQRRFLDGHVSQGVGLDVLAVFVHQRVQVDVVDDQSGARLLRLSSTHVVLLVEIEHQGQTEAGTGQRRDSEAAEGIARVMDAVEREAVAVVGHVAD